jgi:thiol:disulfide interchange protein
MTPIVDGLQTDLSPQLTVKVVNAAVGNGPAIMKAYRVPGHPAVLIFNSAGEEINRLVGPQSRETLERAARKVME